MEEVVVEALLYGDREAQVLAARELSNLRNKQKYKLAERGVIAPLVLMLHTQDYETTEAALFALLSLAFGSERNKILIAKSGAIPMFINLLQSGTESTVNLSIAALLILSSCNTNKPLMAASGAIQILLEILDADNINMQAKLDIIVTFLNLSTRPQIIPSVVLSSMVVTLIGLVNGSEKSSGLVEKATALLEKVVSSSQVALREAAGTSGAIQALVETVEEGSEQCKEHAVGVLLLICQSCKERYRGLILREGALPGLLQLSVDGTRRAKDMARTLLLLLRECSSPGSRKKLSKNVLLEQVMGQIDRGERAGMELMLVEDMIAKLRT